MNKIFLLSFTLLFHSLQGQLPGFQLLIRSDKDIYPTDVMETDSNQFIVVGYEKVSGDGQTKFNAVEYLVNHPEYKLMDYRPSSYILMIRLLSNGDTLRVLFNDIGESVQLSFYIHSGMEIYEDHFTGNFESASIKGILETDSAIYLAGDEQMNGIWYARIFKISKEARILKSIRLSPGSVVPIALAVDIKERNDTLLISAFGIPLKGFSVLVNKLIRTDLDLNPIDTLPFPGNTYGNVFMKKLSDQSFIVSGRTAYSKGLDDMNNLIVAHAEIGDSITYLDTVIIGSDTLPEIEGINTLAPFEGGFYFAGTQKYLATPTPNRQNFENKWIVSRFNDRLEKMWTKRISLRHHFLFLLRAIATKDKGLLLVGTAYDYKSKTDTNVNIYIVKLDSLGNIATGLSPGLLPAEDFLLFPNPGTDYLDISLPNAARGRFSLFDIQGRLIIRQRFEQRLRIPTAKLPAGIYIYRIRDDKNRMQHGKWVKQ